MTVISPYNPATLDITQFQEMRIRTPRNHSVTTPNEWCKLIDRNLYFDDYLSAHAVGTLNPPPVVKKFITTFLVYSANTENNFYSALVTLRVNIYATDSRFTLDVNPLTNSQNGAANNMPDYEDWMRLYVKNFGDNSYNVQLFLRYPLAESTYRIKVLFTSLNDNAYYSPYVDNQITQYGLNVYPDNEYRMNQWLWLPNIENSSLISETALPVVGSGTTLYSSNNILTDMIQMQRITFKPVSEATVPSNTLYLNSADNVLKYSDNSGVKHALY